jgi:hypothetical protein
LTTAFGTVAASRAARASALPPVTPSSAAASSVLANRTDLPQWRRGRRVDAGRRAVRRSQGRHCGRPGRLVQERVARHVDVAGVGHGEVRDGQ